MIKEKQGFSLQPFCCEEEDESYAKRQQNVYRGSW
jgi:hypothetical protein